MINIQKYADIADLNILIKIGLAVEGINLGIDAEGDEDISFFGAQATSVIRVIQIANPKQRRLFNFDCVRRVLIARFSPQK